MMSVAQAIQLIKENFVKGTVVSLPLSEALNLCLANDVIAPMNVPSFNQSAMDGYAFRYEDIDASLEIVDEIPAGEIRTIQVNSGQAVRIFTGAMVPNSCDTVVMQELVEVKDGKLFVQDEGLKRGGNIRKEGHQIQTGEIALSKGTKINPAAIGFLTSLGLTTVEVFQLPKVSILATGDELVKPGKALQKGQVYESNTLMLKAALNELGIKPEVVQVADDHEETKSAIKSALESSDIVLISGGISVGDYDYVKPSLLANGVEEVFYKVNQKPGKPLFFGKKQGKRVFALPGNPAAALTCFYIYAFPLLQAFKGDANQGLSVVECELQQVFSKKAGRAEFRKVRIQDGKLELLEGQGSDVLKSFAESNALAYFEADYSQLNSGDKVPVYLLPE